MLIRNTVTLEINSATIGLFAVCDAKAAYLSPAVETLQDSDYPMN
jgi:hypothetical protein